MDVADIEDTNDGLMAILARIDTMRARFDVSYTSCHDCGSKRYNDWDGFRTAQALNKAYAAISEAQKFMLRMEREKREPAAADGEM
jgi:hypothetical protein